MQWVFLAIAGVFEVMWAISLKWTNGYSHAPFLLLNVVIGLLGSFFLAQAMKFLPVSTAYPIWKGGAIIGLVLWEFFAQRQHFSPIRVAFVVLILLGIVGLKLYEPVKG